MASPPLLDSSSFPPPPQRRSAGDAAGTPPAAPPPPVRPARLGAAPSVPSGWPSGGKRLVGALQGSVAGVGNRRSRERERRTLNRVVNELAGCEINHTLRRVHRPNRRFRMVPRASVARR